MADSENIGQWQTGKLLDPFPPEWLNEFKQQVNTVAEFLIKSLEVVNVMLDVIKSFMVGINDPISALIKKLMKEIKKILKDIQQIGLYFTSDRKLLEYPFKDLLGGYQGAEKRMIGRLTDRTDLGRPNLSPNTLMIGFMFYLSADTNIVYSLVKAVNQLLALFSFEISGGAFAPITNLSVEYTASDPTYQPTFGKDVFSAPSNVKVSWTQASQLSTGGITIPLPTGVKNFIVEVSTEPNGLPIFVTKQDTNKASPGGENGDGTPQLKVYPITVTENGVKQPLFLYGGADRLDYPSHFNYEQATDKNGKLNVGSAYIHTFLADNLSQPIPIHLLKDDSGSEPVHYLQKTFVLGNDDGKFSIVGVGSDYEISIPVEELPKAVKVNGTGSDLTIEEDTDNPPTTYYFRVTPTDKFLGNPFARYHIFANYINAESNIAICDTERGEPSLPYRIQIPRETTAQYQASIESALLCLLLSRTDLDTDDRQTPFLIEDKEKMLAIFGIDPKKYFSKDITIKAFRTRVRDIVRAITYELMNKSGVISQAVEQFVVDSSAELRDFTWDMYDSDLPNLTLRQSFGLDSTIDFQDTDLGVVPNVKSMVIKDLSLEPRLKGKILKADLEQPLSLPVVRATVKVDFALYNAKISAFNPLLSSTIFDQSKADTLDYYINGVLKDENGEIVIRTDNDGVQYVLLQEKSAYFRLKNSFNPSRINGNSPLIVSDIESLVDNIRLPINDPNPMYFTRTVLLEHNNSELLTQSAFVLNIATSATDKKSESDWDFVRLGDQGIMVYVEQTLNTVLNAMESIMQGLQGIIESILKYIDFVQQRINEVQNLIRKINAIIQSIGLFEIPSASILFFASNGTDGVLGDLVSAENKPSDPSSAIGFGGLGLMPIPVANLIVDIFFPNTDIDDLTNQVVEIIE